jgi:hypothetical protein
MYWSFPESKIEIKEVKQKQQPAIDPKFKAFLDALQNIIKIVHFYI